MLKDVVMGAYDVARWMRSAAEHRCCLKEILGVPQGGAKASSGL